MANIASQKKRILRTERERVENRRLTSAIKTYFNRLEKAADAQYYAWAQGAHVRVGPNIEEASVAWLMDRLGVKAAAPPSLATAQR